MTPTAAEALAALENLKGSLCTEGGPFPDELAAVEVVRAFIERAGADSERYRWLRDWLEDQCLLKAEYCQIDKPETLGDWWVLRKPYMIGEYFAYGKTEDAAIDQARAAMLAARSTTPARGPHVTTAAELKQQAKSDMSCVGAFARARPPARTKE